MDRGSIGQHRVAERPWTWAAWAIVIATFCYFAHYRVTNIGGCDSSAYVMESWRLRGLEVGLERDPSIPQQRALVPLCMVEHAGVVRSFFPPGFSVLLAAAGLIGLEFYVTALAGALSGLALFLLARPRAGSPIALATMVAWLATPMALWGGTQVMSDLPSATFLLFALVVAERKKPLISGILVGFAMGMRPETVLFVPALILLLWSRAAVAALALGLALTGLGWLVFVLASFGSLHLPYADQFMELKGENFGRQASFLLTETASQYSTVVALAMVALVRSPRTSVPYLVWLAPFVVLHALWRVPYDAWWHLRFILPGLPALFLLAALGAAGLRDAPLGGPALRWTIGAAILAAYVVFGVTFPAASIHRTTDWDDRYPRDARRIAALLPKEALVGATNDSAPLRYYGRVESFSWCHPEAPLLIRRALDIGRPVYAIVDGPVEVCEERYFWLLPTLELDPVEELPSGRQLVQLTPAGE